MAQKPVDLVGKHEFFVGNISGVEPPREVDGLLKRHIAIIVALDQQYWRFPSIDVRIGR